MKKIYFCIITILCFTTAYSQPGTVELRDASLTLIGQYNGIDSAYAAIPATITQSYIIELLQGYNASGDTGTIELTGKQGSSASNTITIRPAAGVTQITISRSLSGAEMIRLNNADYIIIDGRAGESGPSVLTIENSGTGFNTNTIELINGSSNNIIRNCRIENATTGSSGRGISFAGSDNVEGNSENLIEFCTLASGRYKINSTGTATKNNVRNRIFGCEFLDIIFVGFWAQSNTGTTYIDSCVFNSNAAVGGGAFAILFDQQNDSAIITRNKIYDLDNGSSISQVTGISIRSTSNVITGYSEISNNFIAMSSQNASSVRIIGIQFDGSNPVNARVAFNTVRLSGVSTAAGTAGQTQSTCFYKTADDDSASHYIITNNIFINDRTNSGAGAYNSAIAIEDSLAIDVLNENTYNSASGTIATWGSQAFTDMNLYRQFAGPVRESLSNDQPVNFVSATDLHLTGSSLGDFILASSPVSGIVRDIDGDVRGNYPYRGADEASPLLTSVSEIDSDKLISIYPNPVRDQFSLRIDESINKDIDITIMTIDGRIIFSNEYKSAGNEITISLKNYLLTPGIYFVNVTSNGKQFSKKLLIN